MNMKENTSPKNPIIGVNNYVEHSMAILDRINDLLEKKFDGKQIELAKRLNKKESEISKWLNGVQNFTIFTIAKLEEAFGEPIISVHTSDCENATFVQVQIGSSTPHSRLEIHDNGKILEEETEYQTYKTNHLSESSKENILI